MIAATAATPATIQGALPSSDWRRPCGAPQMWQNLAPALSAALHPRQEDEVWEAPQLVQNRPSDSAPHAGQLSVVLVMIGWECSWVLVVPAAASVGWGVALL